MSAPTVLVTGASRGIGRAVVELFAEHGWNVVAGVRDVAACSFEHPAVSVVYLDVTDRDSIREGVTRAEEVAGGGLAALVSNPGHAVLAPFEDLDMDVVRQMFEVNTFGAVQAVQAALPGMRSRGGGRVVFVSTVGAYLHTPFVSSYRASKAALNAFADTLAVEVRQFGIRVSRVEPGMVATDFGKATRRSETLMDPDNVYEPMVREFMVGFAGWRDWVNIPASAVASEVFDLVNHPDPPSSVLVGEDAHHLVTLSEAGMLEFLGIDSQ